ncbi:MAG: 2Fe-2S iron-sulfur cluster-binding protein [Chloroflexota bacterium]|nr:2Fe-2S iron-sulfur cluster-binding protein [Chloroflexota bacterium]
MKTVSLTIDGKTVSAKEGEKVLWAALDNGIYIPNLCALHEMEVPHAGCRLCFVEIEGRNGLVTACTEPVAEGMVVNTQNPEARRLARTAAELLLSSHPVDCAHCAANGACELQTIARHLGIKLKTKRFRKILRDLPIDSSSSTFIYDPNKCVLCGKCIWVCRNRLGIGVLGFAQRGFQRMVTTFYNKPIAETHCQGCEDCVAVCPVGALVLKDTEKRVAAKQ